MFIESQMRILFIGGTLYDNIVSNNHLTLKDLDIEPADVEKAMIKWLVRFRDRGQFSLGKYNEKS